MPIQCGHRGPAVILGIVLTIGSANTNAASRLGGQTDDSVCDVGKTYQRSRPDIIAFEFIRDHCENGQMLIGSSMVPVGNFEPEIEALAKRFCRIADIDIKRTENENLGIRAAYSHVRCKIIKHDSK